MVEHPELQPADERTAVEQRLDHYRSVVVAKVADLTDSEAARQVLPATRLTAGGIVKHLAWAEDRWFQGRLRGVAMPEPWTASHDNPDWPLESAADDSIGEIIDLYATACERSRTAARERSLDDVAAVASFGVGPVNLRWILVHMIDETARHAGHLDLLRDALDAARPPRPSGGPRPAPSDSRRPPL